MDHRCAHLLELPKVLDRLARFAKSEAGVEACRAIAPFADPADAAARGRLLEQARAWFGEARFGMRGFPPLDGLFAYLERPHTCLDLDALFALREVLELAREARRLLPMDLGPDGSPAAGSMAERWPELARLVSGTPWPAKVRAALARCLSPDRGLKDESSPELMSARREIRTLHQRCTKKAREFVLSQNLGSMLQDDFITIASDRYVLPLKVGYKRQLEGIIHDYSQTGETCYFEPLFLVALNNQLQELKREEREAEREVLLFLTGLVRQEFEAVQATHDMLIELDMLQSMAGLADAMDGRVLDSEPEADVHDGVERPVRLRQARHPLLALSHAEARAKAGKGKVAVPAPVAVDIELHPGQRGLLVSGGNAGGKTVTLKTFGLITMMTMCGLPVPVAEGSQLPAIERVHVFLGDEQSLEEHVSTFTAQITQLTRAWDEVGPGSLVILDEFGAGTDPSQGAALAQAVIEQLLGKGAIVAAATHFPALKAYALDREDVRAASVLFDPATQKPLFTLGYDQVGASKALDVAREHGLPQEILERASALLLLDSTDTTTLIDRLNARAVEREKEIAELRKEREKLEAKRAKLTERYEREQGALLAELKAESQAVLRAYQEGKIAHKKAMKELAKIREQAAPAPKRPEGAESILDFDSLEKGHILLYVPWGKKGAVLDIDHRKQRVRIDMQGVALWADAAQLAAVGGQEAGGSLKHQGHTVNVQRRGGLKVDLRGMRADVAVNELEKFLDQAVLDDYSEVEVVHGRGTGALRREVHEFLRRFPVVDGFALAPEDRGGDGLTVVTLK